MEERDSATTGPSPNAGVHSDAVQMAHGSRRLLERYVDPGDEIQGFGYGGSESLTLFVRQADGTTVVRKVLSERLITARWDRTGQDVMSPPCRKARMQAEFLRRLPERVKGLFPQVLHVRGGTTEAPHADVGDHHEFVYDMSYVDGIEVSRFVREYRPPARLVAALYTEILRKLHQTVHRERRRTPTTGTLESSYFTKIERRLALAHATAPHTFSSQLLGSENIVVDGRHLRNVPQLLRLFRGRADYLEILEPRFHSLVVGDTNTENIKIGNIEPLLQAPEVLSVANPPFSADDLQIRFLDPRAIGFHEDGHDTGADDPMYDNKPWHNSLGNYDLIHGEHFELRSALVDELPRLDITPHADHPYARSYAGLDRYFSLVMSAAWELDDPMSEARRNDPDWIVRFAFVMGTHFMAMPPFHFHRAVDGTMIDDAQTQRRPLAIYAEGIKWLNLAVDMLDGRVSSFLGCAVPTGARGQRQRTWGARTVAL